MVAMFDGASWEASCGLARIGFSRYSTLIHVPQLVESKAKSVAKIST